MNRILMVLLMMMGCLPAVHAQIPDRALWGRYEFTSTIGGGFSGVTRTVRVIDPNGGTREETEHLCTSVPPDGYLMHTLDLYKGGTAVYDENRKSGEEAYIPDFSLWVGKWSWRADTLVVSLDHSADMFAQLNGNRVEHANMQPLPEVRELWFIPEKEGRNWVLLRVDEGHYAYFRESDQ